MILEAPLTLLDWSLTLPGPAWTQGRRYRPASWMRQARDDVLANLDWQATADGDDVGGDAGF